MSVLREKLENTSDVVFTAEFPSVDGGGMASVERNAARLAPWFDAVNATDNPAAHAHTSNTTTAIAMKMFGLEPIMQIVCRDKNRLAIQSDMMGASLHGITNLSLLTGDDVTAGDEPEARRVFDIDSAQAINIARIMGEGKYLSGRPIKPAPDFYCGAVENAAAPPFDYRIQRALKKYRAGAKFLQLQICYHPDRLEAFCKGVAESAPDLKLIPTVVLVKGAKGLGFMNDKVPGIDVPTSTLARVQSASDPSVEVNKLTLELALHALTLPGVRGLHITDFRHDGSLDLFMSDLGRTPKR
ncbi:MAG: methylenetetrahydrofolate reductase [Candidatus Planktophila sp.]|nr:methylenetetrahydrofolate reductase [Candidatus Planktophila sp.]